MGRKRNAWITPRDSEYSSVINKVAPEPHQDLIDSEFNPKKAREFAEVFTPPHIVDQMVALVPSMTSKTRNLDLCAGHGQFTAGMLKTIRSKEPSFNEKAYLNNNHFFSELQKGSCYKLLKRFGEGINLAIGDALKLDRLPEDWRGVWAWMEVGHWLNVTKFVKGLLKETQTEEQFVSILELYIGHHKKICKEYHMKIDQMSQTSKGRAILTQTVRELASAVEKDWQNVVTPKWVVEEMVRAVPSIKDQSKILVLFNIEFLECLINVAGVRSNRVEFGSDSKIEEALARRIYNVKTFSIGKNLDEMKQALNDKAGRYDVVFSNPPYHVQSEAEKSMSEGEAASTHASPIYHEIVVYAIDHLKPHYVCMITPSRWMAGGRGLDDYRARMLKDKHIRLIQDFPLATGAKAVFSKANLPGGVSYFLWDRDYNGFCEFNGIARDIGEFDVLVRDNTACQILRKVITK